MDNITTDTLKTEGLPEFYETINNPRYFLGIIKGNIGDIWMETAHGYKKLNEGSVVPKNAFFSDVKKDYLVEITDCYQYFTDQSKINLIILINSLKGDITRLKDFLTRLKDPKCYVNNPSALVHFTQITDTLPKGGYSNNSPGKDSLKMEGNLVNKAKGLRYNKGKLRYDLLPTFAIEKVVEVYTKGAHKYTIYEDAEGNKINGDTISFEEAIERKLNVVYSGGNNWKNGLDWVETLACAQRHIAEFLKGNDNDIELNTLHLANACWNILAVIESYKIHPDLDNRDLWFKKPLKKVWLDLDGVLINFEDHFIKYLGLSEGHPTDWNDHRFRNEFHKIVDDINFWQSLPSLIEPKELTYPIEGYITARPEIMTDVTKNWLELHGFPKADFINVGSDGKKSEILKGKCDFMIDDSIYNFVDMQSNGVNCFLMTRPHNLKYDVGHFRVNNIKDFLNKVKCI